MQIKLYLAASQSSDAFNTYCFPKGNPALFPSTNFDLQTCGTLSEMTLLATHGVSPCRMKSFSHNTDELKCVSSWKAHFWVGTKTNNSKNKQKTKPSLSVIICLGSGVTIIPECHSSASPVNGNDTPRRQSSVYTKHCRRCSQEGAGLRKSLQSDVTLSSNNFISLAGLAKRHIKKMKGSHLTSNWCFPLSQDSF